MIIAGIYFPPRSSNAMRASLKETSKGSIELAVPETETIQSWRWRQIAVSPRVGNITRKLTLPDGGLFETSENDSVDTVESRLRGTTAAGLMHRIERLTRWTLASLALGAIFVYAVIVYGIPLSARSLAKATPPTIEMTLAKQTLGFLDGPFLQPSKLTEAENKRAQDLFAKTLAESSAKPAHYRLLFRASSAIGPNAFALPDGTIVMTDEMWKFFRHDDEAIGVFAHEIAHVEKQHGLQTLYQASIVGASMTVIAGDISQITQLAVLLPTLLLQSGYSRNFEREADRASREVLLRMHRDPKHLADALKRLEKQMCKKNKCPPSWISSHPGAQERVQLLTQMKRKLLPAGAGPTSAEKE